MKYWKTFTAIWISALAGAAGCRPEGWQAPEAAFVVVDTARVAGNPDSVGTLRHDIVGAWLFSRTEPLGTYPLGARVPVDPALDTLILKAAVRENGLANAVSPYPFLQPVFVRLNTPPWHTDTLRPTYRYYPHTRFWFIEGFEHTWSYWGASHRNSAGISRAVRAADIFEGMGTLTARIPRGRTFEIVTLESYAIDTLRSSVYFEMHYRTEDTLVVGAYFLQGRDTFQRPFIYLKPTAGWRKIYLNFTDFFSGATEGMRVRFFIGARNLDSVAGRVWLDNLKVLSF